jgi:hypothetical protein
MSVTFTRSDPGTYDPETGLHTSPTTSTITGNAIQVRGDPQRYAAAGLNLSTMPTLLFTPTSYNLSTFSTDFVRPGDTTTWRNTNYTVKDVDPIAPDGVVIMARIVIGVSG